MTSGRSLKYIRLVLILSCSERGTKDVKDPANIASRPQRDSGAIASRPKLICNSNTFGKTVPKEKTMVAEIGDR